MHKQFSIYLDLLRFIAALLVFVSHIPAFIDGNLWQIGLFGSESVMIFFVLSGYVISYVVYDKKETAKRYAVSRLARIYSVAIPALLLTFILYNWALHINPTSLSGVSLRVDSQAVSLITGLFFVNQSWFNTTVLSNYPYWSLGYEVQYYILFGIFVYTRGYTRLFSVLVSVLVMGINIILLFPVWLAGVLCYKMTTNEKWDINPNWALLGYLTSLVGMAAYSSDELAKRVTEISNNIMPDFVLNLTFGVTPPLLITFVFTVFVFMNIFCAYFFLKDKVIFSERIGKLISKLSIHTFSLYLLHMPIFFFIGALLPFEEHGFIMIPIYYILVPLLIYVMSLYVERSKKYYFAFFSKIIGYVR